MTASRAPWVSIGSSSVQARRPRGFSLIEVMCALAVLAVGLVGLTEGITTVVRSHRESALHTAAALHAAGRLEIVRAEGYLKGVETEGDCGEDLPNCRWTLSVSDTELEGLHEVSVIIEHTPTGKEVFELRTLIFETPTAGDAGDDPSRDRRRRNRDNGERS